MVESSWKTTLFGHTKLVAIAATAVVLLALLPQIHLWIARGSQWHGAYATLQGDEFLYSAYINALIEGRPRRNDPFVGRDQYCERITSGINLFNPIHTFVLLQTYQRLRRLRQHRLHCPRRNCRGAGKFSCLLVARFDHRRSPPGCHWSDVRLCFGAFAGGQGIIGLITKPGVTFLGLPFLRRYQPAAAFPLFFVFCGLVWWALSPAHRRRAWLCATLAGLTLALLVFSYLYLWTAAAVWLACVAAMWLYLRPVEERLRALALLITTAAIATFAVIPFAYLLSHRAGSLDEAQTLVVSHRPDLFRFPEIIGLLILMALVTEAHRGKVMRKDPRLIFAASLALLPLVLFNQQILTGNPCSLTTMKRSLPTMLCSLVWQFLRRCSINQSSAGGCWGLRRFVSCGGLLR